ncbi:MAG TPA: hypothetical protein VKN18_17230 [Blastocatellia bacterium]|nr:hypothetical protein [Blastocatellia bacterium]
MKRMLACLLLILVVPIITALLQPGAKGNSPLASTALAGHTLAGGFCQCPSPGCICDPGEEIYSGLPESTDSQQPADDAAQSSEPDVSAAAFLFGTGLLILIRVWR